jgi:hypothetical protein
MEIVLLEGPNELNVPSCPNRRISHERDDQPRASLRIPQHGGHVVADIGGQLSRRSLIVGGPHRTCRQVHLGSLDGFVIDGGQQVGHHVQAGVLLAIDSTTYHGLTGMSVCTIISSLARE